MKPNIVILTALVVFISFIALSQTTNTCYTITDLGPGQGLSVNNHGDVLGVSGGYGIAWVWTNGVTRLLTPLPDTGIGINPIKITDAGLIFGNSGWGYVNISAQGVGTFWLKDHPDQPHILPQPDTTHGYGPGAIVSANNSGQAVGWANILEGQYNVGDAELQVPTVWTLNQITGAASVAVIQPANLTYISGRQSFFYMGTATCINDYGYVIGDMGTEQGSQPPYPGGYTFSATTGQPAIQLFPANYVQPVKVNNSNLMIAYKYAPITEGQPPFYYHTLFGPATAGAQLVDIGTLGGTYTYATGINNYDPMTGGQQVVGVTSDADQNQVAFIWQQDSSGVGRMTDLTTLLPQGSEWQLRQAIDINDIGQITGFGDCPTDGSTHAFLMTPIVMAVDYNRDGKVTFDGQDATGSDKPFRFWLNDNVDGEDPTVATVSGLPMQADLEPGATWPPDWKHINILDGSQNSAGIKRTRDLMDYTRVQVKVPTDFVNDGTWAVKFLFTEIANGTPRVNLWKAPADDMKYLTDLTTAQSVLGKRELNLVKGASGSEISVPNDTKQLNMFVNPNHMGTFLLECIGAGKGALTVRVYHNNIKVSEGKTYLDINTVESMYEHWTVGDVDGRNTSPTNIPPLANLASDSGVYTSQSQETQDYILFVHGWRMQPWERRAFAHWAYKCLWHSGYKGRFGLFSWPTEWNAGTAWANLVTDMGNFQRSAEKAFASAPALQSLFYTLNNRHPGRVRVFAHSMGNYIVGEALLRNGSSDPAIGKQTYPLLAGYVGTQAATPSQWYNKWIPDIFPANSYSPNWFKRYPMNDNMHPASLGTEYFWGINRSCPSMSNFYNPQDPALILAPQLEALKGSSALNPEYRWLIQPPRCLYGPTPVPGWPRVWKQLFLPQNRFQIEIWADQARHYPCGFIANVGGPWINQVDLQSFIYNFHSGEFLGDFTGDGSSTPDQFRYWSRMMSTFNILPPPAIN